MEILGSSEVFKRLPKQYAVLEHLTNLESRLWVSDKYMYSRFRFTPFLMCACLHVSVLACARVQTDSGKNN